MDGNRKRSRETDSHHHDNHTAPSTNSSRIISQQSTLPRKIPPAGYTLTSPTWLPCLTPKQESTVALNFNFWMNCRYISLSEVEEFLLSVFCPHNRISNTSFLDQSWNEKKKSNRLIFISINGITPHELSDCIANFTLSQLLTFTSVPVRHTISSTLQLLPSTPNITLPDNFWKYSDTTTASTLLYWPIIPAISYEQVYSYKNSILLLFAEYRLVFKMTNSVGDILGEMTLVSDSHEELPSITGKARLQSMDNSQELGEFQITKRIPLDDKESNDAYLLNINFPKSKRFLQFESLPLLVDEITNDKPLQPLPLIFFSTNSHLENNSISIPIEYEEGEEEEDDENIITFKKEDPNLMVLTLSDVRGSKYPTLSWTADSEQYEVVNVKDGAYWLRLKELFHTCLERSNYSRNCFDPFLTSPFLLDMMGYVTAPSKVRAQSKFSNFNYQSTSSWSKESKKLITKSSRSQTKKGARQVPKGDNPFLALDDDDDDDDDESDESAEVVSEVINREEIDIDMDDEHDHEQHQQPETPPNLFPMNNRLYENVRAICALDCEMCETSYGSELTRISLICPVDGVILDKLVKPSRPIIDYHTKFSGITAELLHSVTTSFSDILKILPTFIGPDTILVGHSLESDLNILGLCHEHIIDTVGLFPHSQGLPYKKSLKLVAKEQLHRDIQSDKKDPVAPIDPNVQDEIIGHDSIEDACIPLELLFQLVIDHYQQLPTEQQETGRHKFLPNVWSSTHSLLSAPNISNTSTTTTAATAGDQPQISCERYTIFHSLIDCQRQSGSHDGLLGNFHLCEPYRHIPPWERYSMGYRHDSNISLAYQQFIDDPYLSSTTKDQIRMNIHHHGSVSDAISGAIHSLQSSESSSSSSSQPHFVWIDMPCNLNVASQLTKSCQGDCLSPHDINHHLEQILSNTQSGDVVCVLTQGDLLDVKKNICKKQKLRWLENSVKTGKASPFLHSYYLSNNHNWTSENEEELIKSAAQAIAGSFFIKYIN